MNDVNEFTMAAVDIVAQRYAVFVELEQKRERRRLLSPLARERCTLLFRTLLLVFLLVDTLAFLGALILYVASDSVLVFVVSALSFTLVVVKMTCMALGGGGRKRRATSLRGRQLVEHMFPASSPTGTSNNDCDQEVGLVLPAG